MDPQSEQGGDRLTGRPEILGEIVGDDEDNELMDHLRSELDRLTDAGLSLDEAVILAVRRVERQGKRLTLTDEKLGRLWRQDLRSDSVTDVTVSGRHREWMVILGLAVAAAMAVKLPELFGVELSEANAGFYARNVSFFVLPFMVGYFAWKRALGTSALTWIAAAFGAAALVANAYPYAADGATEALTAIHLPIALWMAVGVAYTGGRWTTSGERMSFIRFSGEMFIHFVLIALGGGVLTGVTAFLFESAGLDIEPLIGRWLLPCGAAGAVIVAAGLTESGALTKMAPVLTKLFTPLFAIVLVVFLVTMTVTGRGLAVERDILVGFDLLLVLTLCLILYGFSARDQAGPPGAFDILQLILVASALLVDLFALGAIAGRISEFGLSANKVAAAGLNLILLVNLTWTGWLYADFLRGRRPFSTIERWQTAYLLVLVTWAATVAAGFPWLFDFS